MAFPPVFLFQNNFEINPIPQNDAINVDKIRPRLSPVDEIEQNQWSMFQKRCIEMRRKLIEILEDPNCKEEWKRFDEYIRVEPLESTDSEYFMLGFNQLGMYN